MFSSRRGAVLGRDAVERLVTKYATTAVMLLQAGIDRAVIALWLGHESIETTQMYLDADLAMKERALARTAPLRAGPGRYRPSDSLLAFLNAL